MILRIIISAGIFLLPLGLLAQANAGSDKTICDGETTTIGTAGNPNNCYKWTPATGLDDPTSPMPMANPTTTTTYTLTEIGENFASSSTDAVTVTVEPAEVTLVVENTLTECMEGRTLTYTATASPVFANGDLITFTFHYQYANGTAWESADWSFDVIEDNTVVADAVPAGDADHKFTTPIYVEAKRGDCMATSATLMIDVYELWIEHVRHDATHAWKAIVGAPFAYSGIGSSDCTNWDWDMEDGAPDQWNPTGGNAKSGSMTIPNSDLPNSNTPFGDTYGTVYVTCEDGEGNNHSFASTSMSPSQKVKVFYNATATTNPVSGDPNWFVYYKSNYGNNAISYGCNGGRSFSNAGGGDATVNICNEAYLGDSYITTNIMAGQLAATGWSGTTKYYANFVGVVAHERQHANNEVSPPGPANNDTDSDWLTDAFETGTSSTDPNNPISAQGTLPAGFTDDEVYAGGPIEQAGITGADTSQDWAQLGTNW